MVKNLSGIKKTTLEAGILPIYKPAGITTFDVIRRLRAVMPGPKPSIGHTGTLDPIAEGVVIALVNKASKAGFMFENDYKEYEAEAILGFSSDTYDTERGVEKRCGDFSVTEEKIIEALAHLSGTYLQKPPVYSAAKYKGKPSYYWKREMGMEVDLTSKEVTVENKLISFSDNVVLFSSKVSKGTYIRKIISDFGEKLGCGAVMNRLARVKCGNIAKHECISFDNIADYKGYLISLEDFFAEYSHFTGDVYGKVRCGVPIYQSQLKFVEGRLQGEGFPVFDDSGELICFVEKSDDDYLKYKRVLVA